MEKQDNAYSRSLLVAQSYENQLHYKDNKIKTTRFTWYSFLPLSILFQFKRLFNAYLLVQLIFQVNPVISPWDPVTSSVPFAFVILVAIIREGVEDLRRCRYDTRQNNRRVNWIGDRKIGFKCCCGCRHRRGAHLASMQFKKEKWETIRPGDIIKVEIDKPIPADLVLLSCAGEEGEAFIQTANLDGERTLKRRSAILQEELSKNYSQTEYREELIYKELMQGASIEVEEPVKKLDLFEGKMVLPDRVIPLSVDHLLLRGALLSNTEWAIGVAVYCGKESKLMLNQDKYRYKLSRLDRQINWITLYLLIFMLLLSALCAVMTYLEIITNFEDVTYVIDTYNKHARGVLSFFTYFLLYNSIIPLALPVTLEISRGIMMCCLKIDRKMKSKSGQPFRPLSSVIPEDLGNTSHIFTDKTGTLTANEMHFKGMSLISQFIMSDPDGSVNLIKEDGTNQNVSNGHHPILSHLESINKDQPQVDEADWSTLKMYLSELYNSRPDKREESVLVKNPKSEVDFLVNTLFTMALCHDVIPQLDRQKDYTDVMSGVKRTDINYEGGSPDEVELVTTAKDLGVAFLKRITQKEVLLLDMHSLESYKFEMLQTIEFTSERKRMTVIVREAKSGLIYVLSKGADSVMLQEAKPNFHVLHQHLSKFGRAGHRTLVYGFKIISEEFFTQWKQKMIEVQTMKNSEEKTEAIQRVHYEIEGELTISGISALEDRLQDEVPQVILGFRDAAIKVCMITGDKHETAANIALSARIFSPETEIYNVVNCKNEYDAESKLREIIQKVRGSKESSVLPLQLMEQDNVESSAQDEEGYMGADQIYKKMTQHLTRARKIKFSCKTKKQRLKEEREAELHRIPDDMEELGMVIDSHSLDFVLKNNDLRATFIQAFNFCTGVVCCRATPKQKAAIVQLVKKQKHYYSSEGKKVLISTLAIGDGGNDVNMIQVADIGIGIFGKQGNSAANSADYAFGDFKILRRLLLHHGRFISLRFGFFMDFFFFKNFIYTMTQFYYSIYSGFTGVTYWETLYANLYNVITGFPAGALATVEEDIDLENKKYAPFAPYLFRRTRDDNQSFKYGRFFWWFMYGLVGSLINFFCSNFAVHSLQADVQTGQDFSMWGRSLISYAVLMTVTSVIILHEMRYHHWFSWLGLVCTVLMYFPLVTLAYNEQAYTLMSYNFYEFMFSAKAALTWIIISCMIFLPYKMVRDLGLLVYPRYRDLLVQNSPQIKQIRREIKKRNSKLLEIDLEEDEAHFLEKRRTTVKHSL